MMPRVAACIILILFSTSCNNKLDIDISGMNTAPLQCQRLERDLFTLKNNDLRQDLASIRNKYGIFLDHYLSNLLKVNAPNDSMTIKNLSAFVHDRDINGAFHQSQKIFTDEEISGICNELNDCIKRFSFYFPNRKLPKKFITCQSGWNYAFAYTDSVLVSSLDMYLGDSSIYYQMLQLPNFRTRYMNRNYLLPDLIRGWIITEFDNSDPVNTLVHHTIFYGKIYYCVNALLPNIEDSVLMNYSGTQMKYLKEYEKNLWGHFAEKNRLYETNMKTIQELTSDGPFTSAISKECPPRIAMWIGLQIVRSYMKNNEKISLRELMEEKDAQKILAKSKYRP